VLTSSWTGVPNKVAGECIFIVSGILPLQPTVSKGHREIHLSCSAHFEANYLAALIFLISTGQLEK